MGGQANVTRRHAEKGGHSLIIKVAFEATGPFSYSHTVQSLTTIDERHTSESTLTSSPSTSLGLNHPNNLPTRTMRGRHLPTSTIHSVLCSRTGSG